jgi:hypothetical protein
VVIVEVGVNFNVVGTEVVAEGDPIEEGTEGVGVVSVVVVEAQGNTCG